MLSRVPLTLFVNVQQITPHASWNDPLNSTDPWKGYPYQWSISVRVRNQTHSDPSTPRPFSYNGLDVTVGDWLVFTNSGIAVEIVSISSQTDSVLTFIGEDVDLYNILNDPGQSGNGIGPASAANAYDCLIINLNSEGIPVFANIPDYSIPINLISDITNRFQFRNQVQDFIPGSQPGHEFAIGDVIYLSSDGTYHASLAGDAGAKQSIGTITGINQPNVGDFTYRPVGRYVKNLPTLPGLPGDRLYISETVPGGLVSVAPYTTAIPVYIKIDDTSAILSGGVGGGGSAGNIVISGNNITAVNPNGNINLVVNGTGMVTVNGNVDLLGNRITNAGDPVQPQDLTTKSYVDAIASGLHAKEAVNVATLVDLDATYTPIVAYGSLTANFYQRLEIDGYLPGLNDRVLVKNQNDEIENGIYRVVQIGSPSEPWLLSRTTDFNGQPPAGKVSAGDFVFVEYGDTLESTGWVQTTPNPVTVNSSDIHWTQFSSAGVIQPGFGLTKTGTVLDVNVAALIDSSMGLMSSPGPSGHNIIELQLDPLAPLEFNHGGLRVKTTIAGTGLSFDTPSGSLNINSNQPTITELGVVNVGIWNATVIGYQYGGTGLSTIGTPGQVLGVNNAGDSLQYINHSQITENSSAPTNPTPVDGDRWYSTTTGTLFTRITDDTGSHWVEL